MSQSLGSLPLLFPTMTAGELEFLDDDDRRSADTIRRHRRARDDARSPRQQRAGQRRAISGLDFGVGHATVPPRRARRNGRPPTAAHTHARREVLPRTCRASGASGRRGATGAHLRAVAFSAIQTLVRRASALAGRFLECHAAPAFIYYIIIIINIDMTITSSLHFRSIYSIYTYMLELR